MLWQFGSETSIVVSPRASRATLRAAEYLARQVERRCGHRWPIVRTDRADPPAVVVGTTDDGGPPPPLSPTPPEGIALWCGGEPDRPIAFAVATASPIAAVGHLLRLLSLAPGSAGLPRLSLTSHPAYPVRGHTLANHKQNNTYDKWDWAQWEEYLSDLAALGNNVAILYPLHPARWKGSLPFDDPPWFDSPARAAEFARQMDVQRRLPDLCHDLGMRYGAWIPPNDVFPAEVERQPDLTRHGGPYVCLAQPGARERVLAIRERLFDLLPALDVLFIPSRDDGGCPGCERCDPWAPIYLDLARETMAIARRRHPGCRAWLSQQGLDAAETRYLFDYLARERPDWVEAVALGPFGEAATLDPAGGSLSLTPYPGPGPLAGPAARLRAALPPEYRLVLYPDETHTFRCQYPVVGMDPVVQYVWNREDGPAPRPVEMARIHAATSPFADGAAPYSEGNTDDVNKLVWSRLGWDPTVTGEDAAATYARLYFGEAVAESATALILGIETALSSPLLAQDPAGLCDLVEGCEGKAPALLENWRWLTLRLGALTLDYLARVVRRDRDLAASLRYRVALFRDRPDPRAGLAAAIAYLEGRFAETRALLDEIVWTRDRLFAIHRLAVRSAERLQASYSRFDVCLARWKETLARIEAGELADFPTRRAEILGPLQEAEDSARLAGAGVPLVGPLQEFEWERGPTSW